MLILFKVFISWNIKWVIYAAIIFNFWFSEIIMKKQCTLRYFCINSYSAIVLNFATNIGRWFLFKNIIASNIGGIPASITNNYNGLLVEPGNINDLSCALQKLLEDKKFRQNLSANAFKMAKEKYSQEAMVGKYLDLVNWLFQFAYFLYFCDNKGL